jgi:ppGpp synthetase/RelA/SpoT-type nucleotidyltranferase
MQDIGGCRAVVTTIDEVYALREQYRKTSHCMFWSTKNDYIANPKPSGYRSLHLAFA